MFKLAFLGIVLVGFCHALTDSEVMDQWKKFQVDHKKMYKSPVEAARRLKIFKEKLEKIEKHNVRYHKGEVLYEQGVNQFTDWTDEEYNQYFPPMPKNYRPSKSLGEFVRNPNYTAPDSIDWRSKGAVATPKHQGYCGACWSFSATGSLEGQMAIRDNALTELSQQNLIDCAIKPDYNEYGCFGGYVDEAFRFVKENGIEKDSTYPAYDEDDGHDCRQQNRDLEISGHRMVREEDALEEAVGTIGPVSIMMYAPESMMNYKSGIYDEDECNHGSLNHAVLAVGYGEEDGTKYWIVKNSLGATWGENGFFKLKKGVNQCQIENYANTYPVL